MTNHSITLDIPQAIFEQIQQAAALKQRTVDDVMVEAVTAAAPALASDTAELRRSLAQMAYLNDAALWQAARSTMPKEQRERLEALHDKQQREGLTISEQQEEKNLLKLYQETILVRAQAAVLLKHRNYDVTDPSQFQPLE